jgi:hypothetical protein
LWDGSGALELGSHFWPTLTLRNSGSHSAILATVDCTRP